jgi:hypothetical protein
MGDASDWGMGDAPERACIAAATLAGTLAGVKNCEEFLADAAEYDAAGAVVCVTCDSMSMSASSLCVLYIESISSCSCWAAPELSVLEAEDTASDSRTLSSNEPLRSVSSSIESAATAAAPTNPAIAATRQHQHTKTLIVASPDYIRITTSLQISQLPCTCINSHLTPSPSALTC